MEVARTFLSPTFGMMTLDETCRSVFDYISADDKCRYSIIIGTDSEGFGEVDFVSVIVVHRIGKGGRFFVTKTKIPNIVELRQKIHQEAALSLEVTEIVVRKLKQFIDEDILFKGLEIHVDIGRNGPTKDMIKEVVGMIKGCGYNVKIKPDSFGASCVADRYTG
ncbi:MAG: hypothetical protein A3B96_03280 [Candidatus Spechtbacteria bacterium RIFCSPHIGHO2_02_FULL_43_15b]|uniref:DUF458 domain-containing protein n=1 Tax=Candidatus Spechtbacteria bacterium RIFCSPHIGHO2_01_FULL_43_30 TaxID=1802158 RepID=A0A1G2H8L2_9BACT|nr:MAG: hypothetical protein A2827_00365 [Candidatus Spechtbacteria bacterium RIFCSPHIGHO2_01_FULL_43_30]OGZ59775.1 MAG: hypothetical protein A3B96_03280 [Candidatus Spechtbacteria bacterium RIFCSPHIGHO2_02_FULL_43_15b]